MTNSLSLKQCHFVGQSSILFPKYIYESFQVLYNPDRIRFLSLIRGSYSYGEGTGLHPGMRTAATPLVSEATTRNTGTLLPSDDSYGRYKNISLRIYQILCFLSENASK